MNDSETLALISSDDSPYSVQSIISKQSGKKKKASQYLKESLTTFDNLESELLKLWEKESLKTNSGSIES